MGLFTSVKQNKAKREKKSRKAAKKGREYITPVVPVHTPSSFARVNRLPRKFQGGRMGGRSSSSQQTSNNQQTVNNVNDGDFAGASDVRYDESNRSVNDSNNTDIAVDQEYDYSMRDSGNTDKSVNDSNNTDIAIDQEIDSSINTDIRDSNNTETNLDMETDNSINDSGNTDVAIDQEYDYSGSGNVESSGEFSGNSGNVTLLDGGAIEASADIAKAAIDSSAQANAAMAEFGAKVVDSNAKVINDALDFGSDAINEVSSVAGNAISSVTEFGTSAIDVLGAQSETYAESLADQTEVFSDNLTALSSQTSANNAQILARMNEANSEDKAVIAELAKSTALEGQDVVAKTAEKMVMYVAAGLGLLGIALVIKGQKVPVIKLAANGEKLIQTPGKYLSVINADGQFKIYSPAFNTVVGKIGRQYVLDGITEVLLTNDSAAEINLEYEVANIQIFGSGSGSVSIENKPTIARIEEAIQVDAQATVQDGTVTTQSHTTLADVADITIPAGTKVQVLAVDAANDKRSVVLQNLSATETKLRVGASTVAAGRGTLLKGSIDNIAEIGLESVAAVYVHNESASDAKVSVMYGTK